MISREKSALQGYLVTLTREFASVELSPVSFLKIEVSVQLDRARSANLMRATGAQAARQRLRRVAE
jgi:uncharacterized metal-binding protein